MNSLPWKELTLVHLENKKFWYIEVEGTIIRTCLNNGKVIEKMKNILRISCATRCWTF